MIVEFKPIKSGDKLPGKEVIAIGYQNECIVGWITDTGIEIICDSESEGLAEVTHYAEIPERP